MSCGKAVIHLLIPVGCEVVKRLVNLPNIIWWQPKFGKFCYGDFLFLGFSRFHGKGKQRMLLVEFNRQPTCVQTSWSAKTSARSRWRCPGGFLFAQCQRLLQAKAVPSLFLLSMSWCLYRRRQGFSQAYLSQHPSPSSPQPHLVFAEHGIFEGWLQALKPEGWLSASPF